MLYSNSPMNDELLSQPYGNKYVRYNDFVQADSTKPIIQQLSHIGLAAAMVVITTGSELVDYSYSLGFDFTISPGVYSEASSDADDIPDIRSSVDHLNNIREIINPAVSDLASLFRVSRQAIYKWLSGKTSPEDDNHSKILQLSKIADRFKQEDLLQGNHLLKMKVFGGKSIYQLLASNSYLEDNLETLIREAKRVQDLSRASKMSASKAKPTSDWEAEILIPGSPE